MGHWIFIAVLGIVAARGLSEGTYSTNCESMEIMKCLQSTQNDGQLFFPDTQQRLKDYCKHLMTGLDCARNIIDNCVNEADRLMYHNLTKDMVGMNVALCTPGSALSMRFLKHVDCFKSVSDQFRKCSDRYIGNIVVVQSLTQEEQMGMTCCTVHEYNGCMKKAVEGKCDDDAESLVEETVVTALKQSIGFCKKIGNIPTSDCLRRYSPGHSHEPSNLNDGAEHSLTSTRIMFLGVLLILLLS